MTSKKTPQRGNTNIGKDGVRNPGRFAPKHTNTDNPNERLGNIDSDDSNELDRLIAREIDLLLDSDYPDEREQAAKNPKINERQLDRALADPDESVRWGAASNPEMTEGQLDRALAAPDESVRWHAASNPKMSKRQLDRALADPDESVRRRATEHLLAKQQNA